MSSQKTRRMTLFTGSILIVVVLSYVIFSHSFITAFEENVFLYQYDASNFDETYGTPKTEMYGKTRAFIDPDGPVVRGTFFGNERGGMTGLQIDVSPIKPINFINGRYVSVTTFDDWRPSEEWEVEIGGEPHILNVYRSVFGVTVTTATSNPSEGTEETAAIQNLKITLQVELPQWEGTKDAKVGIGYIYIPPDAETSGTPLDPPVELALVDEQQRTFLWGLLPSFSWNKTPYMAPIAPGVRLWGESVSMGSNPVGAPDAVLINLEWSSIAAGVQDVGALAEQRVESSMALKLVMLHMAARPVYIPVGVGGTDPAVGGVPQPPLQCGFLQDAVRDSQGKVMYCQRADLFGGLVMVVGLIFGTLIMLVLVIAILKFTIFKKATGRR
jgi:hypothetical protein